MPHYAYTVKTIQASNFNIKQSFKSKLGRVGGELNSQAENKTNIQVQSMYKGEKQ